MFVHSVAGKDIVLYSMAETATILDRKRITISKWVDFKYIPQPFFKVPKNRVTFLTKNEKMLIGTYAEQEVNAIMGLLAKWDIKKRDKIKRVQGFIDEVWLALDSIRAHIVQGKTDLIDYGFILRFDCREDAEDMIYDILKSVKRPEQTINELSAAIVRELIMRRDTNLTKGIIKHANRKNKKHGELGDGAVSSINH